MDELTNEEKERYEKETRYIRNMLRQIKKDPFISDEERQIKIAELNRKYSELKKEFVKKLENKCKYNRNDKKQKDKKEIERYI